MQLSTSLPHIVWPRQPGTRWRNIATEPTHSETKGGKILSFSQLSVENYFNPFITTI